MNELKQQTQTQVENHEPITNDEPKLLEAFGTGVVAHQGDLMIVGIPRLPEKRKPRANRQLADGNTQGSRHVLERGELFDGDADEVVQLVKEATGKTVDAKYVGPVFMTPANPTANDLTHPEHGNQGYNANQACAVIVQRNLDAEEMEQRARD